MSSAFDPPSGKTTVTGNSVLPDRVRVRDGDVEREMPVSEFASMPLTQRVRYLLAGNAEFFAGSARLDTPEALRCLLERGLHDRPKTSAT